MNPIPYDMLSMCQRICPTGVEQAGFAKLYNELRKAGESDATMVEQLAAALVDGLRHGNWPQ